MRRNRPTAAPDRQDGCTPAAPVNRRSPLGKYRAAGAGGAPREDRIEIPPALELGALPALCAGAAGAHQAAWRPRTRRDAAAGMHGAPAVRLFRARLPRRADDAEAYFYRRARDGWRSPGTGCASTAATRSADLLGVGRASRQRNRQRLRAAGKPATWQFPRGRSALRRRRSCGGSGRFGRGASAMLTA